MDGFDYNERYRKRLDAFGRADWIQFRMAISNELHCRRVAVLLSVAASVCSDQ